MLTPQIPSVEPPQTPLIYLTLETRSPRKNVYSTVSTSYLRPSAKQMSIENDTNGYYSLSVRLLASSIFADETPLPPQLNVNHEESEVTILHNPKYGRISEDLSPGKDISYYPETAHSSNDSATFFVTFEGGKVELAYFIEVNSIHDISSNPDPNMYRKHCPHPNPWRITAGKDCSRTDNRLLTTESKVDVSTIAFSFNTLPGTTRPQFSSEKKDVPIDLDQAVTSYCCFIDNSARPSINYPFTLHEHGHSAGLKHTSNLVSSDQHLAARVGVWYWRYGSIWNKLNESVGNDSQNNLQTSSEVPSGVQENPRQNTGDARQDVRNNMNNVTCDDNGFGNVKIVPNEIGITVKSERIYNRALGFLLNTRAPKKTGLPTQNFLPENEAPPPGKPGTRSQSLLERSRFKADILAGKSRITIPDMPRAPTDDIQIDNKAVDNKSNSDASASKLLYGTIGVCLVSPTLGRMQPAGDSPFSDGLDIYPKDSGGQIFPDARFDGNLQADIEAAKVEILKQPQHGEILIRNGYRFKYLPQPGYTGNDDATVLVNIGGKNVKVVYFIKVIDIATQTKDEYENYKRVYRRHCKKSEWRIFYNVRKTRSVANNGVGG